MSLKPSRSSLWLGIANRRLRTKRGKDGPTDAPLRRLQTRTLVLSSSHPAALPTVAVDTTSLPFTLDFVATEHLAAFNSFRLDLDKVRPAVFAATVCGRCLTLSLSCCFQLGRRT